MYNDIKNYLIILVIFLVIDLPVILDLNADMYQKHFNDINKGPMNIGINTWIGASASYLLVALGIYFFVVKPYIENNMTNDIDYRSVLIKSSLFGLITYGVYNATNIATINMYNMDIAIHDTIWGIVLCSIVSIIFINLKVRNIF